MPLPSRLPVLTVSLAALLAAGPGALPAQAEVPGLDLSFQGTGWMGVPGAIVGSQGFAMQPDGRMLVAGQDAERRNMLVWRFLRDGSPDITFNGTGEADMVQNVDSVGYSLALRSDGRIFCSGSCSAPTTSFTAAAFSPDGRPDSSFGPGGRGFVQLSFPGGANLIALQPDGKILLSSAGSTPPGLVRLQPAGGLDTTFVADLISTSGGPASGAIALAVQPDGKILAGRQDNSFTITRFLANGAKDSSFGMDSMVRLFQSVSLSAMCNYLAVLPDGKILAGGPWFGNPSLQPGFLVARFLPNGAPDPSFGNPATPGRSIIPVSPTFGMAAMLMQKSGAILTAGLGEGSTAQAGMDIVLGRFTAGGLPDNSFGAGGILRSNLGGHEYAGRAFLVTDQKLLVTGLYAPIGGGDNQLLFARYNVPGTPELTVEYPAGTPLQSLDFGPVTTSTRVIPVILRNNNLTPLTNLQATLTDESHPGDFHATLPTGTTLAPGAEIAVNLSLTPSTAGLRTASLHLTADPDVAPRIIPLRGSKATPLQIWRVTWFGSPDNSGPGADLNDFDRDGLPNFMEYATGSHPHLSSPSPLHPAAAGLLSFTYARPSAALTEFSWQPQSAPSSGGPWSSAGITSTVLTDNGTMQTVPVSPVTGAGPQRLFVRLRVTKTAE